MSVTTNPFPQNKSKNQAISLPESLSKKWDINQWLRVTEKHSIFSANNRESNSLRILMLIPNKFYDKKLWKTLLHLPDDKLLVPERIYPIEQMHVLIFPYHTSLKELVRTKGISFSQIIQLIRDLCDSLLCLHNSNLLHGDISADNLYLTDRNQFILGDFSESCFLDRVSSQPKTQLIPHMKSQDHKHTLSKQADLTSLGKLFYLLCNHGNSLTEADSGISLTDLPIFQTAPDLLETLLPILSKMIARNTEEQYHDLLSIQEDLKSLPIHRLEQVNYQLFLPEETHLFHQTVTLREPEPNFDFRKFLFSIPFVLLFTVSVCLLLYWLLWTPLKIPVTHQEQAKTTPNHVFVSTGAAASITAKSSVSKQNTLDIASQCLTTLSSPLEKNLVYNEIYVLLAENNKITDLSDLTKLPNLREIYLSNNQISDLQTLASLPYLEIAVLSDNHCSSLSGLEKLDHLNFLDLSGNPKLENVSNLLNLTSLKILILSDTSVSVDSIELLQKSLPDCNVIY